MLRGLPGNSSILYCRPMPRLASRARRLALFGIVILSALGGGCVQRTLTVRSDPDGALVYLNDQEIGRTPLARYFTWYGVYDVELHKEGYQSIKTTAAVIAP